MLYIVLFSGDRNWSDPVPIRRELKKLREKHGNRLLIVEGGAPGADQLSRIHAHMLNIHVATVNALWGTRHQSAGPQRNEIMAGMHLDEAFFFHPDITKSRGTKDMRKRVIKLNIPYKVVS